jgi:putative ABC transport system permease protein
MQDLRLAVRALRATPIVSIVAVLSLALGIGANTAIFSLVNSLLLRTLPVVEPQRLALLSSDRAIGEGFTAGWTYGIWNQIHQRVQPFDGAITWSTERFNLAQGGGETQPVDGIYASRDFFTTLGVSALLGRTFPSADAAHGGGQEGPVAVISYGLWQRRFGGAANVIGTPIAVERVPFTIIGVTPPAFFGAEIGRAVDVALPLDAESLIRGKESRLTLDRSFYGLTIMLRLKPGQSLEAANAIVRGIQPQVREGAMPPSMPPQFQKDFLKESFMLVPGGAGLSRLREGYERPLVTIFVVVALVLLIACANIANLQLARATARRHELSVRLALGAPRWWLARQLLVESLVLSGVGAVLGLVFAAWSSRILVTQLSTAANRVFLDLSVDWRVLTFTAAVAVATTVIFGTAPALRAARVAPIDALKEHGRGASGDARVNLSSGLVVAQVALSLVLVVAAGLFGRSFEKLATLPRGFDSERVLVVGVNVARTRVDPTERIPFFRRLASEVAIVPGVSQAAASTTTPFGGLGLLENVSVPGGPPIFEPMIGGQLGAHSTFANFISPGWFAVYGTAIRAGRDLDGRDTKGGPPVILVNEAFVRKFLSGQSPVGATVAFERARGAPLPKTVVGVVSDAVYGGSLRDGAPPTEYVPLTQWDFGPVGTDVSISVRASAGPPALLERSLTAALTAVDRDLVLTFRPLAEQVNASLQQERLVAVLSGFFGALALLLAGLGLYGVTAYAVARRRTEIGIRMALGAASGRVVRLVLSRVSILVGTGVLVGAGLSMWASAFVASLLYGLEPRDPSTLIGAAITLAAVGAVAGWLPAYRASRIDPAEVLREV